jgi:hypothetical protein
VRGRRVGDAMPDDVDVDVDVEFLGDHESW